MRRDRGGEDDESGSIVLIVLPGPVRMIYGLFGDSWAVYTIPHVQLQRRERVRERGWEREGERKAGRGRDKGGERQKGKGQEMKDKKTKTLIWTKAYHIGIHFPYDRRNPSLWLSLSLSPSFHPWFHSFHPYSPLCPSSHRCEVKA